MAKIHLSKIIIPKYYPLFRDKKHRHITLTSGRAGSKSSAGAILAVQRIIQQEPASVVILRKHHNKLRKTVYKEILRAIKRLGLSENDFIIHVSPMEIEYRHTGNRIYFSGSDSVDDTKGLIDEARPIRMVILDELTEFFTAGAGADEIQNIEATFIRGNTGGFQMIYLYNPPKNPASPILKWQQEMDARPDVLHIHTTYKDVPPEQLGPDLIESAELMSEIDPKQYRQVQLGEAVGIDDVIYYMFSDEHIQEPKGSTYSIIGIGVDYGQQNATTFQAFGVNEKERKIEGLDEYYWSGRESGKQKAPSDYAKDFKEFCDNLHTLYHCDTFITFIDPSARGLIEEIKRALMTCNYTVMIKKAENNVSTGISRVQTVLNFNLLTLSPQQKNAADEFRIYEYDKKSIDSGNEKPIKTNDHAMDAIRYLVMGLWKKIKPWLPVNEVN